MPRHSGDHAQIKSELTGLANRDTLFGHDSRNQLRGRNVERGVIDRGCGVERGRRKQHLSIYVLSMERTNPHCVIWEWDEQGTYLR
jgi:hypothetical protein